jgi:hypothetical protein
VRSVFIKLPELLMSRKVAVVALDPAKALGGSAFGPLQIRRIVDGVAGEWIPLVTLVRLPRFTGVDCPAEQDVPCLLTGLDLFLLDSVSTDANFARVTNVPDGLTKSVLSIPHPIEGRLYVKLRDDPAVINRVVLDVRTPPLASTGPPLPGPEHLRGRPLSEAASQAPPQSIPQSQNATAAAKSESVLAH